MSKPFRETRSVRLEADGYSYLIEENPDFPDSVDISYCELGDGGNWERKGGIPAIDLPALQQILEAARLVLPSSPSYD